MNRQAFAQWACSKHLHSFMGRGATVKCEHDLFDFFKLVGCNQDGAMDCADNSFNLAAKTVSVVFAVFTHPPDNQQSYIVLKVAQAFDKVAMSLLHVRRYGAGDGSTLASRFKHVLPLFQSKLGTLGVQRGQLLQ